MTADVTTLHAHAAALRARVDAILARTSLLDLFSERFGACAPTGSYAYDLMVWPDIDIHMPVDPDRRVEWVRFIADINDRFETAGLRLHKAQVLDDYVDPHPLGAGLYWGIQFVDELGVAWKSDIWGWEPSDYDKRQARDAQLQADLKAADRDLILRLKTQARERPNYYGTEVFSMDIYRFALARAGTTLAELDAWKAQA